MKLASIIRYPPVVIKRLIPRCEPKSGLYSLLIPAMELQAHTFPCSISNLCHGPFSLNSTRLVPLHKDICMYTGNMKWCLAVEWSDATTTGTHVLRDIHGALDWSWFYTHPPAGSRLSHWGKGKKLSSSMEDLLCLVCKLHNVELLMPAWCYSINACNCCVQKFRNVKLLPVHIQLFAELKFCKMWHSNKFGGTVISNSVVWVCYIFSAHSNFLCILNLVILDLIANIMNASLTKISTYVYCIYIRPITTS